MSKQKSAIMHQQKEFQMKNLLLLTAMIISINSASAIELLNYKSSASGIIKMTDASVEKVWASTTPACIKDGSKLLGVNQAFKAKGLGYRDCSASKKALVKQKMLGYRVVKIGLTSLSTKMAKSVMGIN